MADDDIFQDLFGAPATEVAQVNDKRPRAPESSDDEDDFVLKRKKRVQDEPDGLPIVSTSNVDDDMANFIVHDAEDDRDEVISAGLGSRSSSYDSDSSDDSSSSDDSRAPKVRTKFDEVLDRLKKTKRKKGVDGVNKSEEMEELVTRMMRAASDDAYALQEGRPALSKITLLQEVEDIVVRQPWQEPFIDAGGLRAFHDWLKLLPDGSLPNLTLRSTILRLIERLLPSITLEILKESRIGWAINDAYHHPRETSENKRLEYNLIASWLQSLSRSHGESSAPTRATKEEMEKVRAAPKKRPGNDNPRAVGTGYFTVQPVSKVEPLEKKDAVDTAIGRLKRKV